MIASSLLVTLTDLGIQLKAHGNRLRYRPRSAVSPALVERMNAHKAELIEALQSKEEHCLRERVAVRDYERNPSLRLRDDSAVDKSRRTSGNARRSEVQSHGTREATLARGTSERCSQHIDPQDWLDKPAPGRPGWVRSTCRRCGTFVGFRHQNK